MFLITAAVLGALRAYRPDLSVSQAEQLLEQTASAYYAGNLDATGLFDVAGLAQVVADGNSKLPQPSAPAQPTGPPPMAGTSPPVDAPAQPRRYARPRVRVLRSHARLAVRALNLPASAELVVSEVHFRPGDFGGIKRIMLRRITRRATLTLPLLARANQLTVRFIDPHHRATASSALSINVRGQ